MTQAEIIKRSEIQFQTLNLNIVAAGGLAAIALAEKGKTEALLVVPILSFALFAHWVHLGLTIRLGDPRAPSKCDLGRVLVMVTHAVGILFAFVGVPIIALLAYSGTVGLPFRHLGFILPVISVGLYFLWFWFQYFWCNSKPQTNDSGGNDS